jgi:hypothetical protein
MEKEKPFLFTDLIHPDEVDTYVMEDKDVIPIRTWSRGSPFKIGGGFPVYNPSNGEPSVHGSQSTDGMLNYLPIKTNGDKDDDDGNPDDEGEPDEEENEGDYEEEYEHEDDDENETDDHGFLPYYGDIQDDAVLQASGEKMKKSQFLYHANSDEEDDMEEEENEDGEEDEDYEEEVEEEEEDDDNDDYNEDEGDDGENGSENNGDGEAATAFDPRDSKGFDLDSFGKVALSPRELEMIASSGPSADYNELVNIMNEYNELVTYLNSPRGNSAGGKGKAAHNAAGGGGGAGVTKGARPLFKKANSTNAGSAKVSSSSKVASGSVSSKPQPSKQTKAGAQSTKHRQQHGNSHMYAYAEDNDDAVFGRDGTGEAEGYSDEDGGGGGSAAGQAMLARNKLSIITATAIAGGEGVGAGAGYASESQQQHPRKKISKPQDKSKPKKQKKKLFGHAKELQQQMAIQMKIVGKTEVDSRHKVRFCFPVSVGFRFYRS